MKGIRHKRSRIKKVTTIINRAEAKTPVEIGPLNNNTDKLHRLLTDPDVRKANVNPEKKKRPKTNYPSKVRVKK